MTSCPTRTNAAGTTLRTLIITVALGVAVVVPDAVAEAREPVTRVEAFAAAHRLANQSAAKLEDHSAAGLEHLTNGAASVDRSRTSVGNYLRYSKFRMGASFALFGTNTVAGEARTLWCIGNIELVRAKNGSARVAAHVSCPVS
jgi:hypothetical protein